MDKTTLSLGILSLLVSTSAAETKPASDLIENELEIVDLDFHLTDTLSEPKLAGIPYMEK